MSADDHQCHYLAPLRRASARSSARRLSAVGSGSVLLRQPRQSRQLLQILTQRLGWSSPECLAFPPQNFVGENSALAAEHYPFADRGVLADAHLATEYRAILDCDASGQSGLRGDDNVFAD